MEWFLFFLGLGVGSLVIFLVLKNKFTIKTLKDREKLNFEIREELVGEEYKRLKELAQSRFDEYYNQELKRIDLQIERLREEKNNALSEFLTGAEELKDGIAVEIEEIKEELQILENERFAVVEALRREESIRAQSKYYRLSLSEDDLTDISLLFSLDFSKIKRKEVLFKLIWQTYYQPQLSQLVRRVIGVASKSGIYKITNLLNDKVYIGQSTDIGARWGEHLKSSLDIGSIAYTPLHTALKTDGAENFTFEVLEFVEKARLNEREKYYIKFYRSQEYGYNVKAGNN